MRAGAVIASALAGVLACACGSRTLPRPDPRVQVIGCAPASAAPSLVTWDSDGHDEPFALVGNSWSRIEGGSPAAGRTTSPVVLGELTTMTASGVKLDPIRRALQAKVPALAACFQASLPPRLTLKAVVTWVLRIDRTGKLVDYAPRDFGLGGAYQPCIAGVLAAITFPPTASMTVARVPVSFDSQGLAAPPAARPSRQDPAVQDPWTPFASRDANPEGADRVARAAAGAVQQRIAALETCFAEAPSSARTGSLRTLFELSDDGAVLALRAGGLGNRAVEACIEEQLLSLRVFAPVQRAAEIQCDFARGDAAAWRVSPEGGYDLIAVTRTKVMHGGKELVARGADPDPLPFAPAALVTLAPDAPGTLITLALAWVANADRALITLDDGGAAVAPRFLAMGRTSTADPGVLRDPELVFPMLRLGASKVTACLGRAARAAPLANADEVSALVGKLAAKCKDAKCGPTLLLTVDGDAAAAALAPITAAARHAGFSHVLLGADADCQTPR